MNEDVYKCLRRAAEVHRRIRKWAKKHIIKPGIQLVDLTRQIETQVWRLIEKNGLKSGSAFPTGVSLNNCAAHYTPNTGDFTSLKQEDVLKVDFGIHVEGYIIDCAFTVTFDPIYDNLVQAVKSATNTGIKQAGIDARLNEIGASIQEVMESHEVEIGGKIYPIKAIKNLNGHSIAPYVIHGGKSVPIVRGSNESVRMEEGELYAIETFGSTGRGHVSEDKDCSHYSLSSDYDESRSSSSSSLIRSGRARSLLQHIQRNYSTLPFCRRWLDDESQTKHLIALKQLVDAEIVSQYPPLCDIKGSYTAQWEHTFILKPTHKEVLSRGDDF